MQNFQALGAPPPNPRASNGWGLCPQTPSSLRQLGAEPQNSPLNCEFLAMCLPRFALFIIIWVFVALCFEQFFLHCSVANLMMLTIDICLMLNCVLFEKFDLHYALCHFDSILLHTLSYLFAKV